jgi:hypothetical protein
MVEILWKLGGVACLMENTKACESCHINESNKTQRLKTNIMKESEKTSGISAPWLILCLCIKHFGKRDPYSGDGVRSDMLVSIHN